MMEDLFKQLLLMDKEERKLFLKSLPHDKMSNLIDFLSLPKKSSQKALNEYVEGIVEFRKKSGIR